MQFKLTPALIEALRDVANLTGENGEFDTPVLQQYWANNAISNGMDLPRMEWIVAAASMIAYESGSNRVINRLLSQFDAEMRKLAFAYAGLNLLDNLLDNHESQSSV